MYIKSVYMLLHHQEHYAIFTISHQKHITKNIILFHASISITYSTINHVSLKEIRIGWKILYLQLNFIEKKINIMFLINGFKIVF